MPLNEQKILQTLVQWRIRISASAWIVVRNTHTAEDIYQNVVLKAMTRETVFESEAAVLSWAFVTARREGIDWLLRHRRQVPMQDPSWLGLLDNDLASHSDRSEGARLETLQQCLESVSGEARQILDLRYFDNLDCDTIARQMHLSLAAVYKRLSRLHRNLKDCVERRLGSSFGGGVVE
jgi:RNA polymerase sigma-70 factor (ECF subfamily)